MRGMRATVARIALVGLFAGGIWLLLQYYTEQELVEAAEGFWLWWSMLMTGELAQYWNPIGAAVALGAILLFVSEPIRRLFRARRRGGQYDDHHHYDDDDGDAGADADSE